MEFIENEFVLPRKDVQIHYSLNDERTSEGISLIILKNSSNFMLFIVEEESKLYSTEVYYNNEKYTLLLEYQDEISCIYFDNCVDKNTQDDILNKFLTCFDIRNESKYMKIRSNFLKIIFNLKYKIFSHKNVNINEVINSVRDVDIVSKYEFVKNKLHYRFDLNSNVNNLTNLNNMLIYLETKEIIKPNFDVNTTKSPWENLKLSYVIPHYCLKYISEINDMIVSNNDDYCQYIKWNDELYLVDEMDINLNDNQTLFKYDNKYIIASKYDPNRLI